MPLAVARLEAVARDHDLSVVVETEVVRDSGANRTSAGPETRDPGWDAEANRGDYAFYLTHLSADIEGFTPPASATP